MSYYLGRFYFEKKDFFLLFGGGLIALLVWLNYPVPFFKLQNLALLTIFLFLAKGILVPARDEALFLTFLAAVFLTLYLPILQVLFFFLLAFFILKALRVL